jgi:hypothetical protein
MLNPISFEDRNRTIVTMNRARNCHRTFRHQDAWPNILWDRQVIRDHAKLRCRHFEYGPAVNCHRQILSGVGKDGSQPTFPCAKATQSLMPA